MSVTASVGVFISYRRQETSDIAGRLHDRLAAQLGEDQVFMDVDTIALGVDFVEVIAQAVSTCQVLLAVIGPRWLTATDQDGRRRLEDPDDLVRVEIAAALERNIRVIPILVAGAVMPRRQELPDSLVGLARRNALSVRHESFHYDADRLLAAIKPILGPWEMCRTDTLPHRMDKVGPLQAALRSILFIPIPTKGHVLAAKWISGPNAGKIVKDAKGNEVKSKEFDISGFKAQETYAAIDKVFNMLLADGWKIMEPSGPQVQVYKREFGRPHSDQPR